VKFEEIKDRIEGLQIIGKGWRSTVYRGIYDTKELAFKVALSPQTQYAIRKEGKILEKLKGIDSFPQVEMVGDDFIAYGYIKGTPFKKLKLSREEKIRTYLKVLELAYLLDRLGIKKDEFQNLDKNLLIGEDGKVYLLDFERGSLDVKKPQNVTQFLQLLVREGFLSLEKAIELGRVYRENMEEAFNEVKSILEGSV